jgi:hypothetical protein
MSMPVSAKFSDAEHFSILEEMNCILADPKFNSCKRCVKLFRRLIEGTLDGDQDCCKERMLGIEVFGRDADYDTNADPVVRMAASEIRKRLAHFYQESDQERPVTIRLIPGSYVPEFEFDREYATKRPPGALAPAASPEKNMPSSLAGESVVAAVSIGSRPAWRSWRLRIAVLLLLAIGISAFGAFRQSRLPRYPQWSPLLQSPETLLVCFSGSDPLDTANPNDPVTSNTVAMSKALAPSPPVTSRIDPFERTTFEEVKAFYKVSALLIKHGKEIKFRPCSELSLRDFHSMSAVLIGGTDNPWSTQMLSNLRYSLHFDPLTGDRWIQDAQNPSQREWKVDGRATQIETDYAVIARFFNPETREWVLILAGLFPYGTESATDLMTDPGLAQLIPQSIKSNTNFQIVVQTHIVNRVAGSPAVVAIHTW